MDVTKTPSIAKTANTEYVTMGGGDSIIPEERPRLASREQSRVRKILRNGPIQKKKNKALITGTRRGHNFQETRSNVIGAFPRGQDKLQRNRQGETSESLRCPLILRDRDRGGGSSWHLRKPPPSVWEPNSIAETG